MKNGTAITIVRSSNGYIVYEQPVVSLPDDPEHIATFTRTGGAYDSDGLISFVRDHFEPLTPKFDSPEI
jgi:hypothetical protein